jgi:hypothetical protein
MKEVPFNLLGRIYGSNLLSSEGDIDKIKERGIRLIVPLIEDKETPCINGRSLWGILFDEQFEVSRLPIPDHGVPNMADCRQKVLEIGNEARNGKNILVHCVGGKGRTGLFFACLAKEIFGYEGKKTIKWVEKNYRDGSKFIEANCQREFIDRY